MKVDRILHYKELFLSQKSNPLVQDHLYRYEAQYNWQSTWDIEAIDFDNVYVESLQSQISGSLWGGSKNSAKESMVAMLGANKEFIRSAFRDLFATEKDLGLRCDRFTFYCDEAFKSVKDHHFIDHRHDRTMLSVYLMLEHPPLYCLYDYPAFSSMMIKLESRKIPSEFEIERYMKSMKAIHGILAKDAKWIAHVKAVAGDYYVEDTILMINEFCSFVAGCND